MLIILTRGGEEHQSFASTIHVLTDVNRAPNKITALPIPLVQLLRGAPSILGQRGTLSELGIHAIVKKNAYQARLEDATAHTLRHCFTKNLVDTVTPLDQVATLLGHESLDTTKLYTQPSERDLERAVQRAAGEIIREGG